MPEQTVQQSKIIAEIKGAELEVHFTYISGLSYPTFQEAEIELIWVQLEQGFYCSMQESNLIPLLSDDVLFELEKEAYEDVYGGL